MQVWECWGCHFLTFLIFHSLKPFTITKFLIVIFAQASNKLFNILDPRSLFPSITIRILFISSLTKHSAKSFNFLDFPLAEAEATKRFALALHGLINIYSLYPSPNPAACFIYISWQKASKNSIIFFLSSSLLRTPKISLTSLSLLLFEVNNDFLFSFFQRTNQNFLGYSNNFIDARGLQEGLVDGNQLDPVGDVSGCHPHRWRSRTMWAPESRGWFWSI